jgi:hypothetical protein
MAGSSHTTPCQSPVPQEIISVEQAPSIGNNFVNVTTQVGFFLNMQVIT